MNVRTSALLTIVCVGATTISATPGRTVHDLVTSWAVGNNFSGVVLVAHNSTPVFFESFGLADAELNVPMPREGKFQVASLSKSFTAYAILQLRDDGKLTLDDPLSRFVPTFPNASQITIRQLLGHTSGLAQNTTSPKHFSMAVKPFTPSEAVDAFKDDPVTAAPGERYTYANPNYTLLALVIERASGQNFDQYMATYVFKRLGLARTGHHSSRAPVVVDRVKGYDVRGKKGIENAGINRLDTP